MSDVDTGKRLAALAYATSAMAPAGLGLAVNGIIYMFLAVTTVIVGLRCYVRLSGDQVWGWDDLLAVAGYLASIPSAVFGVISTHYGLGAPAGAYTQLQQIRAVEYFMYYELLYFAASSLTKISITLTVVRLCDQMPVYRWIAIGNAILMMVAATVAGVFVLSNCRPFAVYWNPDLGVCTFGARGLASLEIVSLVGSSFQMLSDWVSALLPFFLISNLQMPQRTKTALIGILGLGILASIAAFARMLFYRYWNTVIYPETVLYFTGVIVVTSQLELGLGVIACSLPPLRRLMKGLYASFRSPISLGQSGLPSSAAGRTGKSGGAGTQLSTLTPHGISRDRPEDGTGIGAGKWSRLHDDNVSQGPIIHRETTVNVERSGIGPDGSDWNP